MLLGLVPADSAYKKKLWLFGFYFRSPDGVDCCSVLAMLLDGVIGNDVPGIGYLVEGFISGAIGVSVLRLGGRSARAGSFGKDMKRVMHVFLAAVGLAIQRVHRRRTRRFCQSEPADWHRDKSSVTGGWLRWLTFTLWRLPPG